MSHFCIMILRSGLSVSYLRRVMKPLAINKELVLMLSFRQVQNRNKVIMAFMWRKKIDYYVMITALTMSFCTD